MTHGVQSLPRLGRPGADGAVLAALLTFFDLSARLRRPSPSAAFICAWLAHWIPRSMAVGMPSARSGARQASDHRQRRVSVHGDHLGCACFPALERILGPGTCSPQRPSRHTLAVIALPRAVASRDGRVPIHRGLPWVQLLLLGFFGMTRDVAADTLSVQFSSGVSAAHRLRDQPDHLGHHRPLALPHALVPGIVIGSTLSTAGGLPCSILGGDSGAMEFAWRRTAARRRQCCYGLGIR